MRQPPSPLLLSARKRRPRRNPPAGAHGVTPPPPASGPSPAQCALVQPDAYDARRAAAEDDEAHPAR